jgi:hypothetical protein
MTYEKAVAHPNFPPRCWSAHYILRRFTFGFLGTFFVAWVFSFSPNPFADQKTTAGAKALCLLS